MATRTKPSDFTGRQREVEAQKAAEELAQRQGQIATAQQIEIDRIETDVFDPTTSDSIGPLASIVLDEKAEEVIIQVVEDIEDMTFGAGTHYSFVAGQRYKVSRALADHLDSIGYLLGRV